MGADYAGQAADMADGRYPRLNLITFRALLEVGKQRQARGKAAGCDIQGV